MRERNGLSVLISHQDLCNTQMQIMRALTQGGLPEAYHVPLNDLAERIEIQKLHDLAEGLGIQSCGIYRAKPTNTSRSTGVAALCVFETKADRDRFKHAVNARGMDDAA
jgi:hypothetical protein